MSLIINSNCAEKSYISLTTRKNEDTNKNDNKDTQKLQKKKHIMSQKEGNYYCTYMVDEEGGKILLNKLPVAESENQNNLKDSIESNESSAYSSKIITDSKSNFEYKQQLNLQATNKKNLKDIMKIICGNSPNTSSSKQLKEIIYSI